MQLTGTIGRSVVGLGVAIVLVNLFASEAIADRHILNDAKGGLSFEARSSSANCASPAAVVVYGQSDYSFSNNLQRVRRVFPLVIDDLLSVCPGLRHVRVEMSLDGEPLYYADARVADNWALHRDESDEDWDEDEDEDSALALQNQLQGLPPSMRAALEKQLAQAERMRKGAEASVLAGAPDRGQRQLEQAQRDAAPAIARAQAEAASGSGPEWLQSTQRRAKKAVDVQAKAVELERKKRANSRDLLITNTPSRNESLLITKSFFGELEVVRKLLADGTNPNIFISGGVKIGLIRISTALYAATVGGSLEVAKLLLENGADPNIPINAEQPTDGDTILARLGTMRSETTVERGVVARARLLLDHGAEVYPRAMLGAARGGRLDLMKLYMENGGDVKAISDDGQSTLTLYLNRSLDPKGLKLLLDAGADPNHVNARGNSALGFVISHRTRSSSEIVDCVRLLLASGAEPGHANKDGETPLTLLARRVKIGQVIDELFSMLMDAEVDLDAQGEAGESALYRLAAGGTRSQTSFNLLIESGANVNLATDEGDTALLAALRAGYSRPGAMSSGVGAREMVRLLLEKDADAKAITKSGDTAISAAVGSYNERFSVGRSQGGLTKYGEETRLNPPRDVALLTDILQLLMERNAAVPPIGSGQTFLMKMIRAQRSEEIEWMLLRGAGTNEPHKTGDTAILIAAAVGRFDIVLALAAAGADVTVQSQYGWTVPMIIARNGASGDSEKGALAMRAVLDKGADPNALLKSPDNELLSGLTAISMLPRSSNAESSEGIFQELIRGGADPDLRYGLDQITAVFQAARWCNGELLSLLIGAGADLSLRNRAGRTVLEEAEHTRPGQCPDVRRLARR